MPRSSAQAKQRQQAIAEILQSEGNVSNTELAERFGVNPMTIRRDLQQLESSGMLVRCYGGAMMAQRITLEFAFDERHQHQLEEKARIGQAAAGMVSEGDTVFLDTGTTTLEIARALVKRNIACQVMTNSLVIASELWGRGQIGLFLMGGQVRSGSPDLAGAMTEWMLEKVSADIAFLGSDGVDPSRGSFAADMETARIAERMVANAERVIVVADHAKLGRAGKARYAELPSINELITDKQADEKIVHVIRQAGVKVTLV